MTANETLSKTRMKVYQLAISGVCQIDIARIIGIRKPTVNAHIKALLTEKFLELDTDKRSAYKVYRKGSKSNILDEIIRVLEKNEVSPPNSVSGYDFPHARGVACDSDSRSTKKPSGYKIPVYNVHHVAYSRTVLKQGDSTFFQASPVALKNGVYQYNGKISATDVPYKKTRELLGYVPRKEERHISFSMYEHISSDDNGKETLSQTLIIYAPTLYLIESELDRYEAITKTLCEDVYAHLERRHGWYFKTDITATKRDVHVAVEEPNLEGLTSIATVTSDDGLIGTSNSDGIAEMEGVGDKALAVMKAYANMPLRADKLEEVQAQLQQTQKTHSSKISMIKADQDEMAELLHLQHEAVKQMLEADTALCRILSKTITRDIETINILSDFGGMYQ